MISTLTVSICLLAAPPANHSGQPAIPQPAPDVSEAPGFLPVPATVGPWEAYPDVLPPDPYGMHAEEYSCPRCWHKGPHGTPCHDWWFSPCNMYQHYPYWPTHHGYYYFRPYHMIHVAHQREIAASWGEDPRNPYAHALFDRVYEAIRAEEAATAEPLPPAERAPPSEPAVPSPSDRPPPAPEGQKSELPRNTAPPPKPGDHGTSRRPTIHLRPASAER